MNRRFALALLFTTVGCTASAPALDSVAAPATTTSPGREQTTHAQLDKRRHSAVHILPKQSTRAQRKTLPIIPQVTTAPTLSYNNGPLIDSAEIYAVYWGSNVDPATTAGLPGFYAGISADAPFMQMLSEYNTGAYVIGHGTFKAAVVDANAPLGTYDATSKTYTVQDQDVQSELSRLVDEGTLPAPDGHNIFMVYFDAQTLIGQGTCTDFCAYHSSFLRNGQPAYYGILPDLGHNGCEAGCGFNTTLNNLYSTSSHELVEAITDADVGDNNLGWIDPNSGNEIADICTDWDGTAGSYNVQSMWSNESTGCRDARPSPVATGAITTTDVTVAPGGTATFNITTSGTAAGPWTLDVKDYVIQVGNSAAMPEYKFTFTPPTVSPGGTAVLKIAIPANETSFGFGTLGYQLLPHIAATDAAGVHRFIEVNLNVVTKAPTLTKITPATGPSLGGTAVVATGTNFAADAKGYFCPSTGTCAPDTNAVAVTGGQPNAAGTSFSFTTPDHATGAARFMIVNPADSTHPAFIKFTFTTAKNTAPTITGVDPAAGPTAGGTSIVITGNHFDQGVAGSNGSAPVPNLTLSIGGTALTADNYFVADAQTIFATTPAHAAGAVPIVVTNADKQTVTKANAFTYGSGNAAASQLSLATTMGPTAGGTYVVINGDNIMSGVTVSFGGAAATVQSVNTYFIGVLTPPHAAGAVPVIVTNPNAPASPPLTFTYVAGPPPPADMTQLADLAPAGGDDGGAVDLGSTDLATGGQGGSGGHGGGGTGGSGGGGTGGSGGGGGHGGGCSLAAGSAPVASPPVLLLAIAALVLMLRRRRRV